jgi:hypothetical protein
MKAKTFSRRFSDPWKNRQCRRKASDAVSTRSSVFLPFSSLVVRTTSHPKAFAYLP